MDAREATLAEMLAETRKRTGGEPVFVPPYNGGATIAGQGTIALELLEQAGELYGAEGGVLDAVVVPVSGGGMISGIATVIKARLPSCLVRSITSSVTTLSGVATASKAHVPSCFVCSPFLVLPALARLSKCFRSRRAAA